MLFEAPGHGQVSGVSCPSAGVWALVARRGGKAVVGPEAEPRMAVAQIYGRQAAETALSNRVAPVDREWSVPDRRRTR